MKTSNFANNRLYSLNGISISRFPDKRRGFDGPEFPPLMPSEKLLKEYKEGMAWESYAQIYGLQLNCLNPAATYERLCEIAASMGASEPILLCFESAKTLDSQPCHRRLVAKWIEESLGVQVPEWVKSQPTLISI
jgi:hypothetical protein